MVTELKESVFLAIANNLPRLNLFNSVRYILLRWAGVNIKGQCSIWSGFDVCPIGNAKNLTMGSGVFINRNFRAAMPSNSIGLLKDNVAIGPNVIAPRKARCI